MGHYINFILHLLVSLSSQGSGFLKSLVAEAGLWKSVGGLSVFTEVSRCFMSSKKMVDRLVKDSCVNWVRQVEVSFYVRCFSLDFKIYSLLTN